MPAVLVSNLHYLYQRLQIVVYAQSYDCNYRNCEDKLNILLPFERNFFKRSTVIAGRVSPAQPPIPLPRKAPKKPDSLINAAITPEITPTIGKLATKAGPDVSSEPRNMNEHMTSVNTEQTAVGPYNVSNILE